MGDILFFINSGQLNEDLLDVKQFNEFENNTTKKKYYSLFFLKCSNYEVG